ncbi:quinon protein alcohol dehydrogenase-like superfamily [Fennellomyces sp. T-0311]|nr:quinon protein alcohol dehydrogenase-like superfamily [Fennellomyces sp. T-0311]
MTKYDCKSEKKSISTTEDSDTESARTIPSFTRNDILVCATHGKIYAMHKHTGDRLWRAEFPSGGVLGTGSMGGIVSVFITDQDRLLIGASGKTACLDLFTGKEIWLNSMKGCSLEEVGVICTPSRVLRRTDRDAPPGYFESQGALNEKPVVLSCTYGKCLAIDLDTGEELWRFESPNGMHKIPSALVDPDSGKAYVGSGRRLYCLNAKTGHVNWTSKVSKAKTGLDYMTLATPWSSRLVAEAYTGFSQFPMAQIRNSRGSDCCCDD